MIIDHILTIKNINSYRKPEQNKNLIEKKIKINNLDNLEFHVTLENKNIYIEVLKNQKTYTFIIGNGDFNANNFDDICELIEDKKVTFFEKNNDFYLELKKNFSFPLEYCIEKTNIIKLNNFMNLFNEDGDNKYNGDIKISKYIKDINSKNNKILKRMENIITEIKVKKEQINKDNAAMGNNIITMDENADIMIFPNL